LISTLAAEGGLLSSLWAGPEKFSRGMLSGETAITDTVRLAPYSLRLGFCHAIDLGRPEPIYPFQRNPEIKVEAMWTGKLLGRTNLFAERRGQVISLRRAESGDPRRGRGLWRRYHASARRAAPFEAKELSDGTLRCLLLVTALLSPRS
jgi:predicted ATPase